MSQTVLLNHSSRSVGLLTARNILSGDRSSVPAPSVRKLPSFDIVPTLRQALNDRHALDSPTLLTVSRFGQVIGRGRPRLNISNNGDFQGHKVPGSMLDNAFRAALNPSEIPSPSTVLGDEQVNGRSSRFHMNLQPTGSARLSPAVCSSDAYMNNINRPHASAIYASLQNGPHKVFANSDYAPRFPIPRKSRARAVNDGFVPVRPLRPLKPKETTIQPFVDNCTNTKILLALAVSESESSKGGMSTSTFTQPPSLKSMRNMFCTPSTSNRKSSSSKTIISNAHPPPIDTGALDTFMSHYNSTKELTVVNHHVDGHLVQETFVAVPPDVIKNYPFSSVCLNRAIEASVDKNQPNNQSEKVSLPSVSPSANIASSTMSSSSSSSSSLSSKNVNDVLMKTNPVAWSCEQVAQWLIGIDETFAKYSDIFISCFIDGAALLLLKASHMLNNMKIPLGHVIKIEAELNALRLKFNNASSSSS